MFKGVDGEVAATALDEYDEPEAAGKLARKRLRRLGFLDAAGAPVEQITGTIRQDVVKYLLGRGFSITSIKAALAEVGSGPPGSAEPR